MNRNWRGGPFGNGAERRVWGRRGWATWSRLALLAVVLVLPFGWLLPIARVARVRATTRRGRGF